MTNTMGGIAEAYTPRPPERRDAERDFQKAVELAALGEFKEAIETLHEITRRNPALPQAWKTKAMLYRLIGDMKMATLCTKTAQDITSQR